MKFKIFLLTIIIFFIPNILFAYDYECTKICNSIEFSQSCRDTWLSMRDYIDQSEKDFINQCIKDCKDICGDNEDEGCFIKNIKNNEVFKNEVFKNKDCKGVLR